MNASYHFLPWVRQGIATRLQAPDPLSGPLPARVSLPVRLQVNERSDAVAEVSVGLVGPGDLVAVDRRQIIRTVPAHGTPNFEPNYLPAVEFDRADIPWLFTPAAADGQGRLRPWISLVVVAKQEGVGLRAGRQGSLPILTIQPPAQVAVELPNLAESWAWAHAQVVTAGDGQEMASLLATDSVHTASRLVCPRRLEPSRSYLACLVPAFEAGRKVGLGLPLAPEDEQDLHPAWLSGDRAPVSIQLPVYFHWEFGTGPDGDFEALVRQLQGRPLPLGVGIRDLQVSDLGFSLPDLGMLKLGGALTATTAKPEEEPVPPLPFQERLQQLLNLPETRRLILDADTLVVPPIYGSRQAASNTLPVATGETHWLEELNLDPRYRAVAGLGTMVVQDQQEQLMAAAWEQLALHHRQLQPLRQAQLGHMVLRSVHRKRLALLSPAQLLQVTGPLHARVRMSPVTLHQLIRQSSLPDTVASPAFRRVARPLGPLARRLLPVAGPTFRPIRPIQHLVQAPPALPILRRPIPGTTTTTTIVGQVGQVLKSVTQAELTTGKPNPEADRYLAAIRETQQYLDRALGRAQPPARPALPLLQVRATLMQRLDPDTTVAARVADRLSRPVQDDDSGPVQGDDSAPALSLDPVLPGPQFPRPMYEALRDLSQDFLLPGAEQVPPNTVTLLKTNDRFVEAYMVGLNHEMSRELLWREYPSDQRATYFRRFWDTAGSVGNGRTDLQPIHLWDSTLPLGANASAGMPGDQLVLLLRGELLRRYPNALIYAVEAQSRQALGVRQQHPIFRGTLEPDMTFLGFDLTVAEARGSVGSPGWFFVIQEQPSEPRFGLDAPDAFGRDPASLASWNELSWGDLVADSEGLQALHHIPVAGRLSGRRIGGTQWGFNSAHMAAIATQRPVRIAIHAADLLPEDGE